MNYKDWYRQITAKLVDYKVHTLGIPGSGYYGKKKVDHILPRGRWRANFLADISSIHYKKHPGCHHLNSSQTMCVNFFAPLLEDDYALLNELLSFLFDREIQVAFAEFEHVDKEHLGDSNFDFYCRDKEGEEFFFEIKYTEADISKKCGAKDQSEQHLCDVFSLKYAPLIQCEGSYLGKCLKEPMVFMTEHYQAFRNMAVANDALKRNCVFLTMKANEGTYGELMESLDYIGGENARIRSLYWEDVVDQLIGLLGKNPDLVGYYSEFKEKYSC